MTTTYDDIIAACRARFGKPSGRFRGVTSRLRRAEFERDEWGMVEVIERADHFTLRATAFQRDDESDWAVTGHDTPEMVACLVAAADEFVMRRS